MVDPGGEWFLPAEHRGARRTAQRCGTLSVCERDASSGESVHVRRLYLRMAPEESDPVVKVVDRYEQHVHPGRPNDAGPGTGEGAGLRVFIIASLNLPARLRNFRCFIFIAPSCPHCSLRCIIAEPDEIDKGESLSCRPSSIHRRRLIIATSHLQLRL